MLALRQQNKENAMKYKNIKTGAVIDAASEISGEDWQALTPVRAPEKNEKVAPVQRRKGKANG